MIFMRNYTHKIHIYIGIGMDAPCTSGTYEHRYFDDFVFYTPLCYDQFLAYCNV